MAHSIFILLSIDRNRQERKEFSRNNDAYSSMEEEGVVVVSSVDGPHEALG